MDPKKLPGCKWTFATVTPATARRLIRAATSVNLTWCGKDVAVTKREAARISRTMAEFDIGLFPINDRLILLIREGRNPPFTTGTDSQAR